MLIRKRNLYLGAFSSLSIALLVFFQNCGQSKVDFGSQDMFSMYGKAIMTVENGQEYTNKRVLTLSLDYKNIEAQFVGLRVAEASQFSSATPVIPFSKNITIDLGNSYAQDGSKDGVKEIKAEFIHVDGKKLTASTSIILDTLAPVGIAKGMLSAGVNGKTFSYNDKVNIQWEFKDPDSKTGVHSGFKRADGALRVGWTKTNNCSQDVTFFDSNYGDFRNDMDIAWPAKSASEVFYICVFARDLAGNSSTILSQPMTMQWKMIGGDNNPGDGGSATSEKVRFSFPTRLARDSSGNLFIYDATAATIRKVDTNGVITIIAGNGLSNTPVNGPALQNPLPTNAVLTFDSQDRLYVAGNGKIFRLESSSDGIYNVKVFANCCSGVEIEKNKSGDIVYLTPRVGPVEGVTTAYIYKIPLTEIESKYSSGTLLTTADLDKSYRYAGDGTILQNTASVPTQEATKSVDSSSLMTVGNEGELFFITYQNGSGYPWGHHHVRLLKKDVSGKLMNYYIATLGWSYQIAYNKNEKKLLISSQNGLYYIDMSKYDFNSGLPVTPVKANSYGFVTDGIISYWVNDSNGGHNEYVWSMSTDGKVVTMDSSFNIINSFGRDLYDANSKIAAESMLHFPQSAVQAADGIIYLYDTLNYVYRKIDNNGEIANLAGKAGDLSRTNPANPTSFDDVIFNGNGFLNGGYFTTLYYDANTNSLFSSEGNNGTVRKLNLTTRQVEFQGATFAKAQDATNSKSWPIPSMALIPSANIGQMPILFAVKKLHINPLGQQFSQVTSNDFITVAGDGSYNASSTVLDVSGDPLKAKLNYNLNNLAADRQFLYSYSNGEMNRYDYQNKKLDVYKLTGAKPGSSISMVRIDNQGKSEFIISDSTSLYHINSSNDVKKLCLKGTNLSNTKYPTISNLNDGNLLVTDTGANRVFGYYYRNTSGVAEFNYAGSTTCPQ